MARSKDEFLGCASCRTVLFRLKGVPSGNSFGVFYIEREPGTTWEDHQACPCGEPLTRMHKATWE